MTWPPIPAPPPRAFEILKRLPTTGPRGVSSDRPMEEAEVGRREGQGKEAAGSRSRKTGVGATKSREEEMPGASGARREE